MNHKIVFVFLSCFFINLSTSSAQIKKKIRFYELDVIRGLYYQPNTAKPYSGTAFDEHKGGKRKLEIPIKDGKIHGFVKEWEKNGKKVFEAEYNAGIQVGKEQQWYATGDKKLIINYLNGQAEGICTEWHKNGTKKSEGLFVNGKEEGTHQWWYDNGQQDQIANYTNGLQEGTVKHWFKSGQKKLFTNYVNGKKEGTTKEWFANGIPKMEKNYRADVEDGITQIWSKKGLLIRKTIYDKGKIIEDYNYSSGSIKSNKGFIQVFNQKESFYQTHIKGNRVNAIDDPRHIIYAVDGMLLRLFDIPTDSIFTTKEQALSIEEQLRTYVAKEAKLLSLETEFPIEPVIEMGQTSSNTPYIHWYFVSPESKKEEQKPRTPQKEHYISIICNKQLLNYYSIVTNSDEPEQVTKMLKRIANSTEIAAERIDLNTIVKQLKNG